MNRMHPGKPPSQRRRPGWSEDWRGRLRTTTRSLVAKLREMFDHGESTNRKIIVHSVRIAIGGDSQPTIEAILEQENGEGYATVLASTAAVYRTILDGDDFNRSDPVMVETFMEEVIKALDDEMGMSWRLTVRKMAGTLAYNLRDKDDAAQIRQKIGAAAKEAFSDKPSSEMSKILTFPAQQGKSEQTGEGLSTAGCFRMILDNEDIDRRDPVLVKDFMAEVEAGIDAGLSGTSSN